MPSGSPRGRAAPGEGFPPRRDRLPDRTARGQRPAHPLRAGATPVGQPARRDLLARGIRLKGAAMARPPDGASGAAGAEFARHESGWTSQQVAAMAAAWERGEQVTAAKILENHPDLD